MAFEQNQQDQFNMNNSIDQVKQFQAELDKATASIGAAELEAEEELLGVRLKNLSKAQQTKLTQLGQMLELEKKEIQELAKLKLTLSNRQFAIRKQEIQKEFQLYKAEAERFYKSISKYKVTTPAEPPKKASSTANDLKASTKTKAIDASIQKADRKVQSAEYAVGQVSQEITDAISAVQEIAQVATKAARTKTKSQVEQKTGTMVGQEPATSKVTGENSYNDGGLNTSDKVDLGEFGFESIIPAIEQLQRAQNTEVSGIVRALESIHKTGEKDGKKNVSQTTLDLASKLVEQASSTEEAIAKVREFNENKAQNMRLIQLIEEQKLSKALNNNQKELAEDLYKTETGIAHTLAHKEELLAQEGQKLANEHKSAVKAALLENIAIEAKANDLVQNERKYYAKELNDLERGYKKEQNKLTEEGIKANAERDYVTKNEAKLQEQELHKLRNEHVQTETRLRKENIAALAKSTDLEKNRQKYLDEAAQKLKNEHANKQADLKQAAIDNEAKKNDLENPETREQYILEARLAHENAFYAEKNKLEEERINALAEIEWNNANRKAILDQEEQKERLGYLKEYQELQADGFNHLTENMTAAEFEKLRAETAATEKAIAARSKISEASEKALATIRGKGTLAEKKQLLEAQVKERAAQKDWSQAGEKFQITDDMSDEEKAEVQKRRENAAKAEMAVNAAMGALANLAQKLNDQTDKIGAKQAPIDTRLQGSQANDKILGSYWKQLARDMNKIGAVNPYFTQEEFASNIETLVNRGISFDIKQRAFLMTIQEKIANTFDVADGTLLRLIRIQQQDTTAGRLGMESALNSFLNSMYETSEYLTDVASSVRGSLEELQALMEGAAGTELEFQIQKWMGSLYSVGMSQDAVQSIAQTFGQIASGDVSGLTGSGAGNLLIMAANEAGMSIADILQEGLDAKETNELMQAMVNYLAEIAETSSDSRVVQQQLANVYGIKASDLKAATNLASSIKDVSNQDLTYSGMLGQLNKMANSMALRTSTGEFFSNIWDNVQYTMATQMANDPILYLLPRVATLLEDYAGGIDLPFLNVMGFGVDLNTSVAQLMNVASMSGSILGALGPMMQGLASAASGSMMLNLAGINTSSQAPVIARGSAPTLQNVSGASISESGYIGNSSGEDVKNATLQDAEDSKKKQMVEAKEAESADDIVIKSQQAIIDIYNLLEEVAHGSQSLRVRVVSGPNGIGSSGGYSSGSYGSSYSGGSGGSGSSVGDTSGSGSTGAGLIGGTDNGNWVLTF